MAGFLPGEYNPNMELGGDNWFKSNGIDVPPPSGGGAQGRGIFYPKGQPNDPAAQYAAGMAAGQDMSWMTKPGALTTAGGGGYIDPSTGRMVGGGTGNTGVNGGIQAGPSGPDRDPAHGGGISPDRDPAHGRGVFYPKGQPTNTGVNGGGGGNVRDQFIEKLKATWPQKAQDPNWLNQQADYFVQKAQSGETMGNGQPAPLSYWMDRASGMGASGADSAETGQWAGGDPSASSGNFSGNATNPYGDFSYQGLGSLGQFNAPDGSGTYQPFGGVDALGNPTSVTANQITPQQASTTQAGTQQASTTQAGTQQVSAQNATVQQAQTAQAQAIMASPAYAQAGPAVQAQMLANPEKFGGVSEADMKADPSYAFRLSQGQGALENNNAARGLSRTGGAYKGLIDYGQNAASQEYANVYGRKFNEFNNAFAQNYQVGSTNAANKLQSDTFNSGQTQQNNQFNANAQTNANMTNAGAQNQVGLFNAGAQNSTSQFNAGSANQASQFNAGSQNQSGQFNAGAYNNAAQFNAGSQNQAGQFNAGAYNNAAQFNAGAQNQTGQFNVGNNLNAQGQNVSNSLTAQGQNNANQLAYQGQRYGQASNTYGLNSAAQNQAYNQALGTYGANLQGQNQGYTQALGRYNANVNAGLGYGNLGVSQGQLGLGYGNLGLNTQGQNWRQGFDYNNELWNRDYKIQQAGNPNNGGG